MFIAPSSNNLSPAALVVVGLYVPGSIIKSIDPVLFLPAGEFKFVFVGIVSTFFLQNTKWVPGLLTSFLQNFFFAKWVPGLLWCTPTPRGVPRGSGGMI